jgi:hypothetical protein
MPTRTSEIAPEFPFRPLALRHGPGLNSAAPRCRPVSRVARVLGGGRRWRPVGSVQFHVSPERRQSQPKSTTAFRIQCEVLSPPSLQHLPRLGTWVHAQQQLLPPQRPEALPLAVTILETTTRSSPALHPQNTQTRSRHRGLCSAPCRGPCRGLASRLFRPAPCLAVHLVTQGPRHRRTWERTPGWGETSTSSLGPGPSRVRTRWPRASQELAKS